MVTFYAFLIVSELYTAGSTDWVGFAPRFVISEVEVVFAGFALIGVFGVFYAVLYVFLSF